MSSFLDELERVGLVDGLGPELGQGADHHPRLEVLLPTLPRYYYKQKLKSRVSMLFHILKLFGA
jgi:hypothetical protein